MQSGNTGEALVFNVNNCCTHQSVIYQYYSMDSMHGDQPTDRILYLAADVCRTAVNEKVMPQAFKHS